MKVCLLAVAAGLVACVTAAAAQPRAAATGSEPQGPAADYPVVVGEPYRVSGLEYVPSDVLNYDEVGYAVVDPDAKQGVTAAHHTLPLPSYVEVTSLESGRTILVRVERRGPMDGNSLIALSADAMVQLGVEGSAPVRVRRVNPPEEQRALLRAGQEAPLRIDTPMSLVEVLKKRLPASGSASLQAPAGHAPEETSAPAKDQLPIEPKAISPMPAAAVAPTPAEDRMVANQKGYGVQAATMSTRERAERVARQIGGTIAPAGTLFRVRTGPFPTRREAEASLAKVKAAGYTDARIFTTD
ncbi:conserved hypothetical protein [Altererythrobacter sp. B11]|uniref:septal ring lytic transglycosylase RlpA family protein n=1 Tax=Altererythrobacter sp. B11 TaxID=2060312 RepID=UPI000DC6EE23|nr:SPOR domain-containing protein [Altererythrobacter sp. B11]BBC73128.1 conserved hypothetical protein [Altererythrobacter sp. B11]